MLGDVVVRYVMDWVFGLSVQKFSPFSRSLIASNWDDSLTVNMQWRSVRKQYG